MGMTEATVDEVVAACESMAGLPDDGEPLDQLEHALQGAAPAAAEADDEFTVAALLHDIARAPTVAGIRYDGPREHHEEVAARWLTPRVGARAAWLAEQHAGAVADATRRRAGRLARRAARRRGS